MPECKSFTIEFYTGQVGADGDAGRVSQALQTLVELPQRPIFRYRGKKYEIRNLHAHGNGQSFHGVFAKFREDDIPHAGRPGEQERELDLAEDEGLIEKNHFLYYRRHELLVYQRNGNGSRVGVLAQYISEFLGETTVFNPVLQPDATRRLMRGNVIPRSLKVSFTRPDNPDMYPDDEWNHNMMRLLGESGGIRMSLKISGDGRSSDRERRYLTERMKRAVSALVDSGYASVAQMVVEEDGIEHPIDLIADRILSSQEVEMNGRYPIPESMFAALRRAKDEEHAVLQEIFGEGTNILD